jgi:thymidine kinase
MFAGKSSEAKRQVERHRIAKRKCLLIKHASDDERLSDEDLNQVEEDNLTASGQRYKTSPTYTHTEGEQGITAISLQQLADLPSDLLDESQYVFVDEGQWFVDLEEKVLDWVRKHNKKVYVYGIDSDFAQRPMWNILSLMPFATTFKRLQAVCMVCYREHASLTVLRDQSEDNGGQGILSGGHDRYEARCVNCVTSLPDPKRREALVVSSSTNIGPKRLQ